MRRNYSKVIEEMRSTKNRLAELQSMTTMADIKVGLAKTYRIAELMED
ncbi:hypothetical protein ACTGWG_11275 [Streptococcus suis]